MSGDIVPSKSGVIVLSGYGVSLTVSRGHLVLSDGIGAEQRSGRISRVDKQLKRLIVIGRSGFISFEAVQWLQDTGISFIQMDYDSNILLINTVLSGERIALRRAQALAPYTDTGIAITRYLLELKLQGQANTIETIDLQTSVTIQHYQRQLADAQSLDTLRWIEAQAAVQYWAAFVVRPFPFIQKDAKSVPLHWRTLGARISPLTNSPRKAVTPFHAMLNYLYALLEGETSIALRTIGFDPHLGILHTDQEYRRSFASDVVEPVRPVVDRWLLDTIASRSFAAKDFTETNEGEARLSVAIRRLLSETVPLWRRAAAPIIEHIAGMLTTADIPTVLTQHKRASARPQNNGKPKEKREVPITLPRKCKRCGELVPKERRVFCSLECRAHYQAEKLAAGIEQLSDIAQASAAIPLQRKNNSAPLPDGCSVEWYIREIAPSLATIPIATIRSATGLSRSYCKLIKRGKVIPHISHWKALHILLDSFKTSD